MTLMNTKFVEQARKSPMNLDHGDHVVHLEATDAAVGEGDSRLVADLSITVDGTLMGYITPYSDDEHGVVAASDFGTVAPVTFHTVEGALEQLLPGVADGFATPALQE